MSKTALLVLIFTLTFVVSPLITPPFDGFEARQLPNPQPDPAIQPAGYAFSIWGVIYLWLLFAAIWGVWKTGDDPRFDRSRLWLAASLAIGTPWLWIAGQSAIWATVGIWAMQVTAVIALLQSPKVQFWTYRTPVALYAGWLTAAAFVSLAVTLAGYNIGFSDFGWAVLGIPVATVLAVVIQWQRPDAVPFSVAVAWALVGIVAANVGNSLTVVLLAGNCAVIIAAAAATAWYRNRKRGNRVQT